MSFENTAFYAAVESMVRETAISAYETESETEQLRSFLETARCDAGSLPGLIYNGDVQAFYETHQEAIVDVIGDLFEDGCDPVHTDGLLAALRGDVWQVVYPAVDHVMALMLSDLEADAEAAE